MQLIDMFFDEIEDAKKRKVPFIIPIGTIEYHAHHASCGTDTMVINGVMRELEKEKEIVVCPPIWYGVASYAVGGPETGTIQVDEDAYTNYLYCILKSMIYGGVKNIYCVAHHQTEEAGLMPMTIACHKAAKKVTMEYMEDTMGRGWWGSNSYADYYENLGTGDDPFSYIKVIPLIGKGLWDDIWGYIALEKDMNTVSGIVMAHKGETPGLGAEIATPGHQALYKGKTLFEKGDFVSITLRKGGAKDPAHEVDAITGGTKTSDGVTMMLRDNLSEYLPFFEKARTAASAASAEESNDQKVESNE